MDFGVLLQTVPVGGYISAYKILPLLVACLLWWRLLTWIDKDAPAARLPREIMNLSMAGGFVFGFLLFLLLPGFWLAFAAFIVVLLASIGVYLGVRNQKVGLQDLMAEIKGLKLLGAGGGKRKHAAEEVPGAVLLQTKDGRALIQPEPEAPERPAYDVIQLMLTDPLRRNMERLELGATEAAAVTQYWVDGVMYSGSQFNKATAAAAITVLKRLAGMDLNEKRKPQKGFISATIEGKRHEVQVQTAGSTVGENLRLLVDPRHRHELKLDDVGMKPEQVAQVEKAIGETGGVVLIGVPKGQGLTTLAYAIIRRHDAFLTHIHSIEREPEEDLEGITQNRLGKGVSPNEEFEKTQWVISQEPDAILVPEIANPKTARALVEAAANGRRVYIGIRSGSAADAINDWRQVIGDDDLATRALRMVISGRLVRKLCPACKQPYQPDADTLRKLNLDHGRVQQFFQARTQPLTDQKGNPIVCTFCAEMRYRGRTGVFEVMDVNDEVRQAIMANSSANQLRALYRKMRGRFIQEHALDLVESGDTSIQEVLRAMRLQEQDPRAVKAAQLGGTGSFTGSGTASPGSSGTHPAQPPRPNRPQGPGR